VLANPKVHVTIGDAREVVSTTRSRYDLIFSEPSNPYRAGIASLFTREFYQSAAARLDDDGLFVQWLQAYNVDAQTVRTIYATLASVFPDVETWITEESDLLLIAGKHPMTYDVAKLRARIGVEPWKSALARVWRVDDLEGVFARYVANAELARAVARLEGPHLNTDDMTLVEFGFARGLGFRTRQFDVSTLRSTALEQGYGQPHLTSGTLDAARVTDRQTAMLASDWRAPPPRGSDAPAGLRHRTAAVDRWEDGSFAEALTEWRAQNEEPSDSIALAAVAESLADAGDAGADRYLAQLRPTHAVEADLFLGRLRLRQKRFTEAADALDAAFARAATDPWPLPSIIDRGFDLAVELAGHDRAAGERLYGRLLKPLAVQLQNDHRRRALVDLAYAIDWPRLCKEALAQSEPDVPWTPELLSRRARCYEVTGDARLKQARRDLNRFLANEPMPFANGFPTKK
jgi:hypothetical protein